MHFKTKQDIDKLIQLGEGQYIEFKESFDKSLQKEIVAFANASGGVIYLGVSDTGKLKGIEITNRLKSQIQDIAYNCDPSIIISLIDIGNILEIDVAEGKNKPYSCSNGFFMRMGANAQKMTRNEILALAIKSGKVRYDEQICSKFDWNDFDDEKLKSNIIINNKGELLFPESEFGKKSEARNRLLVDLLARTDFMEKAGTGIKRVTTACNKNGNSVHFEFSDSFWITIESNHKSDNEENVTENVTENRHILILRQIKVNNKITIDQLAEAFNITRRTIMRDIEKLKEKGILKRIGPAKGGHWEVDDE